MLQTASLESFRQAAFNTDAPGRLARVVDYGAALGRDCFRAPDAMDAIEAAIYADGVLPIERQSQRRAWEHTRARAMNAFQQASDAATDAEAAELRAYRAAPAILGRLVDGTTIEQFATIILAAEPLVGANYAMKLAERTARCFADAPREQRAPDPNDAFGTIWLQPTDRANLLHSRARDMLKTHEITRLRLVTSDEALNPPPWEPLDLKSPKAWKNPTPEVFDTLRSIEFDASVETPPPAWLAKGLLPRTGIGLLFGESGAGKSFAAIHAALSVAWGLPLFGAKVKQGAVLYVAAEGGKSVTRRFKAAQCALDGAISAVNLSRGNRDEPLSPAPIEIVIEAPDLSREGDPGRLVRTISLAKDKFEARGYRLALVVIDTWHASLGGGEENSAADAGHALKPLIAASGEGDFLSLIVHHPGKDAERGARGSNALPAAADAIIAISVPGHEGAKAKPSFATRQATVTKMRDGEAGGGFSYKLNVVEIGTDEDGDPVTTCVVEPCDAHRSTTRAANRGLTGINRQFMTAVQEAISEHGTERVRIDDARLRFDSARPHSTVNANRMAWARALKDAIAAGRVDRDIRNEFMWLLEEHEGA